MNLAIIMKKSYGKKVRLVDKENRTLVGKVGLYEDEYDSGSDEPCIGIDLDVDPNLFNLSDIKSLEIIQ